MPVVKNSLNHRPVVASTFIKENTEKKDVS